MYRRGKQETIDEVLERLQKRIKNLEEMSTRQSLPIGFEWTTTGATCATTQLLIRRKCDGTTVVVFP